MACDVTKPEQVDNLASTIGSEWGTADIVVHCLAFADRKDLEGSFSKTSKAGFDLALDISAYSLVEMAGKLRPVLSPGAAFVTLSYLGAARVVPNYNVMGVAKAALESSVRYLAAEMGPDGHPRNAISPAPSAPLPVPPSAASPL